jgi:DNA replication protein DnaC
MLWRDDIAKIKSIAMEPEERQKMMERFKNADVLYIDDLFKTGRNPDGSEPRPTAADINAAFEIINYRYNNPSLLTIISSELNEDELLDIDEAVGGRIFERSKSISIAKNRNRNYRIRKAVTL